MIQATLPALIPLTSLLTALFNFCTHPDSRRARLFLNLLNQAILLLLVIFLLYGVSKGQDFFFRLPLFLGFDIVLHADPMSLLFVTLSAGLWLLSTVYAVGYFRVAHRRDLSRFFGFFSLCICATTGIALAGNIFTYFFFYELLTLVTYPLVTHWGDKASLRAGRTYLSYTLIGGAVLLAAIAWLKSIVGAVDFVERGILSHYLPSHQSELTAIFVLLIIGFGVKAAIWPLHGWLPEAMVAPAPVSSLLHAVAVVKAGAFGIVRVIYDVYGSDVCTQMGVRPFLAGICGFTILYGSVRALQQDSLKKRLAFSTVSQLSYITLGAAVAGPLATIGGIVHLVNQGVMKITMFFVAGNLAEELHVHKISEMNGVARRMPWTMGAFSIAALGMIGLPPFAGFVSKWYLAIGAYDAEWYWVLGLLMLSATLNAIYFLPILYRAWFLRPAHPFPASQRHLGLEVGLMMLIPPVTTAVLTLLIGLFANAPISPLQWARLTAFREYGL
jgi:multicomponent Na+:H+ antiporter subunit D